MRQATRHHEVALAIVGAGLAGSAAAVFALQRQINTAQVGNTGAIAYTTGYLDLLGVHPAGATQLVTDPWSALDRLRADEPEHPYSRLSNDEVRHAFMLFTQALSDMGVGYSAPGERNLAALTPVGTTKPTLSVPLTMLPGIVACERQARTLFVDFRGLGGYSAKQIVANLRAHWPRLDAARLAFPEMEAVGQLHPEVMARALQVDAHRAQLAERLNAAAGDAEYVGLPAILGIHRPDEVLAALQEQVHATLFEVPTMPPGVPGIRLREMFQQVLPAQGLTLVPQQKVETLRLGADGCSLQLHDNYGEVLIRADAVILATGRFLSGGLVATREGVRERLLDLPVLQPPAREDWFSDDYLAAGGHPVNRAGIAADDRMRPLNESGEPISERLFCAGSLLAHHDWVRQRSGAGIAIATAYRAVESAAACLAGPLA